MAIEWSATDLAWFKEMALMDLAFALVHGNVPMCARCWDRDEEHVVSNPFNDAVRCFGEPLCDDCVEAKCDAACESESIWAEALTPFARNH